MTTEDKIKLILAVRPATIKELSKALEVKESTVKIWVKYLEVGGEVSVSNVSKRVTLLDVDTPFPKHVRSTPVHKYIK